MDNKVIINPPLGQSSMVVHMLEGNAPDPINLVEASFTGNIYAVEDYLKGINQYKPVKETAVIVFSTTDLTIDLDTDPHNPIAVSVIGRLQTHPKIIEFGINTDKRFDSEGLKKIIKLHPHLFVSKESHSAFLRQLGGFKAKIERDIENSKDTRGGSKSQNNTQVIDLEIEEVFKMKCPLFKGGEVAEFDVSVCYEVSGTGVSFYLESSDLIIMSQNKANEEFARQREAFIKEGYVTIVQ